MFAAFLAALSTVALVSTATAAPSRKAATTAKLSRLAHGVVAAGVPGVVVLARDGRRTIRVAQGRAQLRPAEPLSAADRFRVGSITKSFVASVLGQLAGEGKLGLDDSLERWVPGAVPNGQAITIRQLLGHRSGIYDYLQDERVLAPYLGGDLAHVWTPDQLIAIANEHPSQFAPGSTLAYSNTNYTLLGKVIQAVTGRPVGVELDQRIFKPLNLRSTLYATGQDIPRPYAHGYFNTGSGPLQDVTRVSPTHAGAAGAIVSTAGDLARFYRALLGGRLVPPAQLAAMETLSTSSDPTVQGLGGYGLGIFTVDTRCGPKWGHDGGIAGYDTLAFNTKSGRGQFVVLTNSITADDQVGTPRAQRALGRLVNTAACASF